MSLIIYKQFCHKLFKFLFIFYHHNTFDSCHGAQLMIDVVPQRIDVVLQLLFAQWCITALLVLPPQHFCVPTVYLLNIINLSKAQAKPVP
jgi:hypothetical protein